MILPRLPLSYHTRASLSAVPDRNAPIVVYADNAVNPTSQTIVDRLVKLGYTKVYKSSEGLQGWLDKKLPTNGGANIELPPGMYPPGWHPPGT